MRIEYSILGLLRKTYPEKEKRFTHIYLTIDHKRRALIREKIDIETALSCLSLHATETHRIDGGSPNYTAEQIEDLMVRLARVHQRIADIEYLMVLELISACKEDWNHEDLIIPLSVFKEQDEQRTKV